MLVVEKKKLLKDALSFGPQTINEAINRLFMYHHLTGQVVPDWKFYLQLNKLFAPLERDNEVRVVGYKRGETGHLEKVWELCDFEYPVPMWICEEVSLLSA